ncbi:MAG: hypothetical protein ACRD6N_08875, partial [Pyrinomonadaceae bacterium]
SKSVSPPSQLMGPFYPVIKPIDLDADMTCHQGEAGVRAVTRRHKASSHYLIFDHSSYHARAMVGKAVF